MCATLFDPMDYSPPGSYVHGLFQARILEWVAIFYSKGSSRPRDQICISCVSCNGRWIPYHCATWEAPLSELQKMAVLFELPRWLRWESSILLSLYPFQWLKKSNNNNNNKKKPLGSPCSTKLFSCQDMLSYVLILIVLNYKVHFFHLKLESFPPAFL